jgi:hypothetical protein
MLRWTCSIQLSNFKSYSARLLILTSNPMHRILMLALEFLTVVALALVWSVTYHKQL